MKYLPLFFASVTLVLTLSHTVLADGPADNKTENVRRIPKLGIELTAEQRASVEQALAPIDAELVKLRASKSPLVRELLPDVEIFAKALRDALQYQEFFDPKDLEFVPKCAAEGLARAQSLAKGEAPWTKQTGLVVRGYRSTLDDSVQPFGMVIPANYPEIAAAKVRCDVWLHGRGETLSELNFLRDRTSNVGQISPADTVVLHPYGRYCNANKFAGEIDILESLTAAKRMYRINERLVAMRGFSMGGAGAWQMAVHYPDMWFAANPGAGFSETPDFLKVFQNETLQPRWWEKQLWQWYDCTVWSSNLVELPTIAYSGEIDKQKQAADIMAIAMQQRRLNLEHIIGPQTAHSIHPDSKKEIEARLASIASVPRPAAMPHLHLTTYTLRYPQVDWIRIEGMQEHWTKGTVAGLVSEGGIRIDTTGVTDLAIHFKAGTAPIYPRGNVKVTLDQQELFLPGVKSDRSLSAAFYLDGKTWMLGKRDTGKQLRKKPGLQGPIDDAFLSRFLFVKPSGKSKHELVEKWTQSELARAIEHWRRHFRGEARVKLDSEVTAEDIADSNLILWGDATSNSLIAKINDRLPVRYSDDTIVAGEASKPSNQHALVAIYPNPENPEKYVVLNSSFTFRDYAYLNNARQVPMLPDWAIVDLTTPPGGVWPGKIVEANFFDEAWQLKPYRDVNSTYDDYQPLAVPQP